MKHDILITVVFPLLFGLMSLFFFILGLRGIVTRKPFVLSSRWLFALTLLGFAPSILHPLLSSAPRPESASHTLLTWLPPAMFIVLAVFLWLSLRGHMAFAVTEASFREGLLASLKKLELPHEETLGKLRLPSVGADLQVAVQSWIGTGQLKMKQRRFAGLLGDIADGMNEYYQEASVPVNLTCCTFYVLMGMFLLVFAGLFLIGFGTNG